LLNDVKRIGSALSLKSCVILTNLLCRTSTTRCLDRLGNMLRILFERGGIVSTTARAYRTMWDLLLYILFCRGVRLRLLCGVFPRPWTCRTYTGHRVQQPTKTQSRRTRGSRRWCRYRLCRCSRFDDPVLDTLEVVRRYRSCRPSLPGSLLTGFRCCSCCRRCGRRQCRRPEGQQFSQSRRVGSRLPRCRLLSPHPRCHLIRDNSIRSSRRGRLANKREEEPLQEQVDGPRETERG
jgi:hypothetical protein